jgi:hypothetical protein
MPQQQACLFHTFEWLKEWGSLRMWLNEIKKTKLYTYTSPAAGTVGLTNTFIFYFKILFFESESKISAR